MRRELLLAAVMVGLTIDGASARKILTERERIRQQAEHLCYGDVQRLCNDAIPDEGRIAACMKAHHGELSPACRKVFDAGQR